MVAEVALLQKYFGFGRTALRSALLASAQQAPKHPAAATSSPAAAGGAATSASAAGSAASASTSAASSLKAKAALPERLSDRDMIELLFSKHE